MNICTFMNKIKEFFRRIASYISPAYVTMLVAAFILWYITKLGDTYTTDHMVSGAAGLAVAVLLALKNKSLIVVAACSCAAVFLTEQLVRFL